MIRNDAIKEYQSKSGHIRYRFFIYRGVDDEKGYPITIRRQGFKTYQDAEKEFQKIKNALINGTFSNIDKRYKVKEIYRMWFDQYKLTVKESTYVTTERIITKHILPSLGNVFLDHLSVVACQKAVNEWFEQAPKTFKRYIVYTNQILDYAERMELIKDNPMRKIIRPKRQYTAKEFTNFYSKEELIKFLECCKDNGNPQIYMFFRLLAFSGMRKGEALALKWSSINFSSETISITETLSQGENNRLLIQSPKTRGSVRTISIDDSTMKALRQWKVKQRERMFKLGYNTMNIDQLVFCNTKDQPLQPSRPTIWLELIQKKYHLRHISVHGFRHTHCSLLFSAGVPIADVKERLGHSNIETTMNVYTHVTKKQKKETADKFANFMTS